MAPAQSDRGFRRTITEEIDAMQGIEWNLDLLRVPAPVRSLMQLFAGHESLTAANILTNLSDGE